MRAPAHATAVPAAPRRAPAAPPAGALGDLRFSGLLGTERWSRLAPGVRQRFGKRLEAGRSIVYAGRVLECRMSRLGWLLAQAARLIGGPLPTCRDRGVATVVTVTEDAAANGQYWTRTYARHNGFPQVIHSSKRFAGPTGLEEYLGSGIGMALTIHVVRGALLFRSAHFYVQLWGHRLPLPRWLLPIRCAVSHMDRGQGRFAFVLDVASRWTGTLIRQISIYQDVELGGLTPAGRLAAAPSAPACGVTPATPPCLVEPRAQRWC